MVKQALEIDKTDRKILSLYAEDPEMSQVEMAKAIGISQPSVGARLRKLKDQGIIAHVVGMNFKEAGLNLAKIDIKTNCSVEILETFKNCPYFLNGFVISGNENLCLFFIGEDISTIESIVDGKLRSDPRVQNVDMNIVISPVEDLVFKVKMVPDKTGECPCKSNCGECSYYATDRCMGCPSTDFYRGMFW